MERPIRDIRDGFFDGRTFITDEALNEQASHWLEATATVRRHGTPGKRPVDCFEQTAPTGVLAFELPRCRSGRACPKRSGSNGAHCKVCAEAAG